MEDEKNLSGRAKVRTLLIDPLNADGLVRPRAVSVAEHDAFLLKLAERLAYMEADRLTTLREVVLGLAEGAHHNVWPSFATIWNNATRLQTPPDDERHIMTSWLRSIEGPVAREGGYLVELHEWLRKNGRPPGTGYVMGRIREEAEENARQRQLIAERVQAGVASADDRAWLDWYARKLAYCEGLVRGGEERRMKQGMQGDAA